MRHVGWRGALWLGIALLARPAVADVKSEIDALLADPYLARVQVGVKVVRLGETPDKNVTLYDHRATTPLNPASNLKIITTAAALEKLGADFKFQTILAAKGKTLAIIGDGDPTLGDAELLRDVNWTTTTVFENWAAELKKQNLVSFDKLLVDDSVFDQTFTGPNWPADQLHKRYVAGVAGLNLNANCLDFYLKPQGAGATVNYITDPATKFIQIENTCVQGTKNAVWLSRDLTSNIVVLRGQTDGANADPISVTVHDPSLYAGTVLSEVLNKAGVVVDGVERDRTVRDHVKEGWRPLAVHETGIESVLKRANKDSMNLYAEALCKRLAFATTGKSGNWKDGTEAVGQFLVSCGVQSSEFTLDDGCGLSRKDLVSPDAIVSVLTHQFHSAHRDLFVGSLAVAGVDGTLKDRFRQSPQFRRVFGKSGFIDGVSCLSGYLQGKDGSWYAFSIMFNGIPKGTNSNAKPLQEKIVRAIEH